MPEKKRLRWKKDPHETGLAAIGAGPRSSRLQYGEIEAAVNSFYKPLSGRYEGWYWVVTAPGHYQNTCNAPCKTEAEAKAQAMQYVKQIIKETGNA